MEKQLTNKIREMHIIKRAAAAGESGPAEKRETKKTEKFIIKERVREREREQLSSALSNIIKSKNYVLGKSLSRIYRLEIYIIVLSLLPN